MQVMLRNSPLIIDSIWLIFLVHAHTYIRTLMYLGPFTQLISFEMTHLQGLIRSSMGGIDMATLGMINRNDNVRPTDDLTFTMYQDTETAAVIKQLITVCTWVSQSVSQCPIYMALII